VGLEEMHRREQSERELLRPYTLFFKRVLNIAAESLSDLCQKIGITDEISEMIWSVVKVLLSQETDMLYNRHLDQLIMCSIYGVCRIHQNCLKPNGTDEKRQVLFNQIIEAYKDLNKKKGTPFNLVKPNSVSWVFVEVLLDQADPESMKVDIIQFYNKVYLNRMKAYIIQTKQAKMDPGSKTPMLNKSSYDALLTPGGRPDKPGIRDFYPETPLICSTTTPRQQHIIYRTEAASKQTGDVMMTPMTKVLHAEVE
jgi:retinoblastoma-like protein 1